MGSVQPHDRLAMAATVANRLFFAGEAASKLYPATVHGAYLSGLDVSNKVIGAVTAVRARKHTRDRNHVKEKL